MNNPIDLLPISEPIMEDISYSTEDFYNNIVTKLIPDIIRIMNNGIPIDLIKVKELEKTVQDVLNNSNIILTNNYIIKDFLKEIDKVKIKEKKEILKTKAKTRNDFLTIFDVEKPIHRSYFVEAVLKDLNLTNKYGKINNDTWKVKEIKELNNILNNKELTKLLEKDISYLESHILTSNAMYALADDKVHIYNKRAVESKIEAIEAQEQLTSFNPNSTIHKRQLLEYLEIEVENTTPKGNPSINRKELEKLKYLLDTYILKEEEKIKGEEND